MSTPSTNCDKPHATLLPGCQYIPPVLITAQPRQHRGGNRGSHAPFGETLILISNNLTKLTGVLPPLLGLDIADELAHLGHWSEGWQASDGVVAVPAALPVILLDARACIGVWKAEVRDHCQGGGAVDSKPPAANPSFQPLGHQRRIFDAHALDASTISGSRR